VPTLALTRVVVLYFPCAPLTSWQLLTALRPGNSRCAHPAVMAPPLLLTMLSYPTHSVHTVPSLSTVLTLTLTTSPCPFCYPALHSPTPPPPPSFPLLTFPTALPSGLVFAPCSTSLLTLVSAPDLPTLVHSLSATLSQASLSACPLPPVARPLVLPRGGLLLAPLRILPSACLPALPLPRMLLALLALHTAACVPSAGVCTCCPLLPALLPSFLPLPTAFGLPSPLWLLPMLLSLPLHGTAFACSYFSPGLPT